MLGQVTKTKIVLIGKERLIMRFEISVSTYNMKPFLPTKTNSDLESPLHLNLSV